MNYLSITNENFPESNAYVISGEEQGLIFEAQEKIEKHYLINSSDFDKTILDDENFTSNNFICAVNQMPFFTSKRIVVVKNIQKLLDNEKKAITEYLNCPNDATVTIFVDNLNNGVFKEFEKYCEKIECRKLTNEDLKKFIIGSLEKVNKTISTQSCNLLINLCFSNLQLISNEIVKLSFNDSDEITDDIIVGLVPYNMEYEIYELTNALSIKQADKAIKILDDMLKNNISALGLISNNFRRMFYSAISDNLSVGELAKMFKVKEFAITKLRQQAKNFGVKNLKRINELIQEVDYLFKSGQMNVENATYYLVFNILKN